MIPGKHRKPLGSQAAALSSTVCRSPLHRANLWAQRTPDPGLERGLALGAMPTT